MAYLKRSRRSKNGWLYESWSIVESVRTAKGPRQRTIATLGKGPEYEAEERVGWDEVVDQLSGRSSAKPPRLFEPTPEAPSWAEIDLMRSLPETAATRPRSRRWWISWKRHGRARRIWVLDRGMVSEGILKKLRARPAVYVVGTPRAMLRRCERELLDGSWEEDQAGVEVQEVCLPDGPGERFLLCRSRDRVEKDRAIVEKMASRLEEGLTKLQTQIRSGRERSRERAERRVGRLQERYPRANRLFKVKITESTDGLEMDLSRNPETEAWMSLQNGCYLLRTNVGDLPPAELWRTYIGLTEAEAAFRELKSPLGLRPIYHQKEWRVEAHIFIAFLALCLRRSLALWMERSGLGTAPNKLLEEMRQIHSLDVVLTAKSETEIRLRVVSTPEESTRMLLHRLGIRLPNRPKIIQNVVATLAR